MVYKFFLDAFVTLVTLPANIIRFGITPSLSSDLTTNQTAFNTNFGLYVDPTTHSTPVVNDMNVSYMDCYRITEGIRRQIKANTTVVLTGLERLILAIPTPPPPRRHVATPDIEPVVVCVFKTELMLRFIAFDPTNPFRRAKPKDVSAIGIKTVIVNAGAPTPGIKDYIIQNPENLTEFEMLFTSDQVGKTLYIICYYLNGRNEPGKDGPVYSVTII